MGEHTRCDICGSQQHVQEMVEAEIIGRQRQVCQECHQQLKDVW
ncbi:MAG: hypothetical protein SV186_01535 [Candidatus Nanohaloarchaea archaeon]|nr:hypothetical protein [Candidatus Nanohaloarchaea archaeon]